MPVAFHTDQVGSLIRPVALLEARQAYKDGKISLEQRRAVEDTAILETLKLQRSAGIAVLTDGELRRDSYMTHLSANVDGFAKDYPISEQHDAAGAQVAVESHGKPVEAKVRARRRITADEVPFMLQHAGGAFKVTMPSPPGVMRQAWRPGLTDMSYHSTGELLADLTDILRGEIRALVADGVNYIQLDEGLARYCREGWRKALLAEGQDPNATFEADLAAENACWDAVNNVNVTRAVHLCRGNRTAWGGGRGDYEWLAEQAFGRLHCDRLLLEYDTERAGGFEPLRFVPAGKTVVLGLVSSKTPRLESLDELLHRIDEAARFCPLERLALSAQCGFQSAANPDGAFMTIDEEKRKLELIVETASKVWR